MNGRAEWARGFHGSHFELLYSCVYSQQLIDSSDINRTKKNKHGVPLHGTYLHSEADRQKVLGYVSYREVFRNGLFWTVIYEMQADRAYRLTPGSNKNNQWVQPSHSLRMEAVWIRALSSSEMTTDEWVTPDWNPENEAHPCDFRWNESARDEAIARIEEIELP